MPTPPKTTANMTKHLTRTERQQREDAETVIMPARGKPKRAGPLISKDPAAKRYWDRIWRLTEEQEILDTLDEHTLTGLCSMLAMRDRLAALTPKLVEMTAEMVEQANAAETLDKATVKDLAQAMRSCSALSDKRIKLDAQILSYADKLGLTPSGRSRLAVHKAPVEPVDEDADLFG